MGGKQTKIKIKKRRSKSKNVLTTIMDSSEEEEQRKFKIILLGTGGAGKSTIAKQMKILIQDGFTEEEREDFKDLIHGGTIRRMQAVLNAMDTLQISFESEEKQIDAQIFQQCCNSLDLTPELAETIQNLMLDSGVKNCFEKYHGYLGEESQKYFIQELERISRLDYIPTIDDVLRCDIHSTGLFENTFSYKGTEFTFIETSGRRSERKKWLHSFKDTDIVLFCVSMSDYDQVLLENEETNCMRESMKLFESICNHPILASCKFILVLNKKDLLEAKVERCPFGQHFAEFKGENTYEEVSEFIKRMFEDLVINRDNREIFTYITSAIDSDSYQPVLDLMYEIMTGKYLS